MRKVAHDDAGPRSLYRSDPALWIGSAAPTSCAEDVPFGRATVFKSTPSLTLTAVAPSARTTLGSAGETGFRSTAAPAIVADTLSILAEIAYEQAKSRAYDTIADGIRTEVCDRLVLTQDLPVGWSDKAGTTTWTVTLPKGELLPGTCDTLATHTDFVSLANAADDVATALLGDVVGLGGRVTTALVDVTVTKGSTTPPPPTPPPLVYLIASDWARAELKETLKVVTAVLKDDAAHGSPPDVRDGRLLLARFAGRQWGTETGAAAPPSTAVEEAVALGLRAGFQFAGTCVHPKEKNGSVVVEICSADEVVATLAKVESAITDAAAKTQFQGIRPSIEGLVLDLARIAATSDRGDTSAVTQAALDATFQVMDLVLVAEGTGKEETAFVRDVLHQYRGVVLALATNDVASALSDGAQLLLTIVDHSSAGKPTPEDKAVYLVRKALQRVLPAAAVLASNAHSLAQAEANPDDAAALREARKEALEGLIKASTNRSGRDGDWVASLGANVEVVPVRFDGDLRLAGYDTATSSWGTVPIALPMGIAVQHLPNPSLRQLKDPKGASSCDALGQVECAKVHEYLGQPSERVFAFNGVHFQLSLVDLAQFLGPTATLTDGDDATDLKDELQWSDFLITGGQIGFAFGRAKDTLVLGIDGRYAPFDDHAWQASLFASYYVPFFDLN